MKLLILLILASGIVGSCSPNKDKMTFGKKPKKETLEGFLTGANDYVTIPLVKMASGHLHMDGTINGIEGSFILDTGAGATVIDTKEVEKFGLKIDDTSTQGAGAGGQTNLQKSVLNNFTLGNIQKTGFDLYVMNIDHVNTAFKSMGLNKVDGVIGADILTLHKGIIDYSNLTLYLKK